MGRRGCVDFVVRPDGGARRGGRCQRHARSGPPEAALLDRGLPYRRALSPSTHVLPASERASPVVGDSELHCSVVEEADAHPSFPDLDGSVHRFVPAASVKLDAINGHAPERSARPSSARYG